MAVSKFNLNNDLAIYRVCMKKWRTIGTLATGSDVTSQKSRASSKRQSVQQKQVQPESNIFGLEVVVRMNRDAHRHVQILLERIARHENERINDSKTIKRRAHQLQAPIMEVENDLAQVSKRRGNRNPTPVHHVLPGPVHRKYEVIDAADETEDEHLLFSHPFGQPSVACATLHESLLPQ